MEPTSLVIAGAISSLLLLYAFWQVLREYVTKSPFDSLPGPPASSFLYGNFPELSQRQSWKYWAHLADTYGPVSKITGMLGRRVLLVHDPKAIYNMFMKDQEFWPKGLNPSNDFSVLLGPGVLSTKGAQHRKQRKLLNPVFSAAHLRTMTHIFYGVAHKARDALISRLPTNGTAETIDVNSWMGRMTLEMLGQAGLGYSFDDFSEDSMDSLGDALKLFFPVSSHVFVVSFAVQTLSYVLPDWIIRRMLAMLPLKSTREIIAISDTIVRRSQEIINEKREVLRKGDQVMIHEIGEGKDLMSTCLKANMAAAASEKLTDEELLAQMSTFILAGMDTSANALSRVLHLLSENSAVQEKLRSEVLEARGGPGGDSDPHYDDIMKLPYLDAVCRETLRLHAPVAVSSRTPTRDMVLPLSAPIRRRDGTSVAELVVPRGTMVITDFQASNCNKALWGEDAREWRPERWLRPLPDAFGDVRMPGIYASLMTFGGGARACIGFKFSQLEMKVVLFVLLSAFSFELTEKPIAWNSSTVGYPTMGEESTRPEMLLRVKVLQS